MPCEKERVPVFCSFPSVYQGKGQPCGRCSEDNQCDNRSRVVVPVGIEGDIDHRTMYICWTTAFEIPINAQRASWSSRDRDRPTPTAQDAPAPAHGR
jgi:hypothetical protein